jgi:hypothetical protein
MKIYLERMIKIMNFKEKTEQIKTWARDNKGKIIIGVGVVTTIVIGAILVNNSKSDKESIGIELDPPEEFDCGRDLEMHFIDPENGDVLWKELCTESYMNDCKDSGMEYEAIRKLNGLE